MYNAIGRLLFSLEFGSAFNLAIGIDGMLDKRWVSVGNFTLGILLAAWTVFRNLENERKKLT